jgi:prepilin-type N-terminal cleavage/methylation domain-containing protein
VPVGRRTTARGTQALDALALVQTATARLRKSPTGTAVARPGAEGMGMRNLTNTEAGFTLIEVMVSIVILSIGVLGLAPLMAVSVTGNSFSNEATRANVIAQDKIEELKNVVTFGALPRVDTATVDNRYRYTARVDDTGSDGTVPAGVYKIYIRVNWTDHSGVARRLEFFTYKTK